MADAISRVGEGEAAPGFLLLRLLSLNGWSVYVTAGFAGGVLVIAEHPLFGRVEKQAESVASLACDLVDECRALSARGPMQ